MNPIMDPIIRFETVEPNKIEAIEEAIQERVNLNWRFKGSTPVIFQMKASLYGEIFLQKSLDNASKEDVLKWAKEEMGDPMILKVFGTEAKVTFTDVDWSFTTHCLLLKVTFPPGAMEIPACMVQAVQGFNEGIGPGMVKL